MEHFQMYVGGEGRDAASGEWIESQNPFTGETWAMIPRGSAEDAAHAVSVAEEAFRSAEWRGLTPTARGALLRRVGDLIGENGAAAEGSQVAGDCSWAEAPGGVSGEDGATGTAWGEKSELLGESGAAASAVAAAAAGPLLLHSAVSAAGTKRSKAYRGVAPWPPHHH